MIEELGLEPFLYLNALAEMALSMMELILFANLVYFNVKLVIRIQEIALSAKEIEE